MSKQLCFSTLSCPEWPLKQMVENAHSVGVAGIDFRGIQDELDVTRHPAFLHKFDETMALLAAHHVRMPCLNSSVRLVEPDQSAWRKSADEFDRYAALAGRTGTGMIRVFGGAVPDQMTRHEARKLARSHLQELIEIAAGRCRPVVETHDSWRSASGVLELLDGFAPRAAVLWDIEHTFRAGESPEQTVSGLGEHLAYVHLKDSVFSDGIYKPLLLGEGELPVDGALRALSRAGYRNWLCLETERRWHPSAPPPEVSVPQFVRFVRQALCRIEAESALC